MSCNLNLGTLLEIAKNSTKKWPTKKILIICEETYGYKIYKTALDDSALFPRLNKGKSAVIFSSESYVDLKLFSENLQTEFGDDFEIKFFSIVTNDNNGGEFEEKWIEVHINLSKDK